MWREREEEIGHSRLLYNDLFVHIFGISYSRIYIYFFICLLLFSDLELKPVGTLEVKLVQAKELTNKDLVGKSDPYAVLYIRPLRDRMKTSKTIVRLTLPFVLYPWICLCKLILIGSFNSLSRIMI